MRVIIVDDHRMFREGIRSRLEQEPDIEVVGEASSAEEALELIANVKPSLVILDIRLPGLSGIELARGLRRKEPDVKVLALTGYDYDQYVRAMARAGVSGYLLKDAPLDDLVQAIGEIARGGVIIPPKIAAKVIEGYSSLSVGSQRAPQWEFTLREIEVLELLYQGMRNSQIASQLRISRRTVENHVSNIISKLEVQTRGEAIKVALENGLIK